MRCGPLEVKELEFAEVRILHMMQVQSSMLRPDGDNFKPSKQIAGSSLTPMVYENVLRVGGRLENSPLLSFFQKHPVIVPKAHQLAHCIVWYFHLQSGHAPHETLLATLRSHGFWVVAARSFAKNVIHSCWKCTEESARVMEQQLAPLPVERVARSFAFEHVGLDFFGSFHVKQGRRHVKRYCCIFVCCTTRAVHLEPVWDLTTDAFLCTLARFIARRGYPSTIFSDNGTNLKGADNDFKELDLTDPNISRAAVDQGIHWYFHPPKGSSHAGHYERLIRSSRRALRGFTNGEVEFLEDNFNTVLCEIEKVLNDRPLTPVSDNIRDPMALTPNDLVLLRSNSASSISEEIPVRRVFTQANEIADLFWSRWMSEYLPQLIARQKCLVPKRNVQVNDVCLMAGEDHKRGQWPICIVTEAFPDSDGLVRRVKVKTSKGNYERPINKLALLEGCE